MSSEVNEVRYRQYFNRKSDWPLIWSVDEGTQATEKIVKRVITRGVRTYTETGPGDNQNSPTAWIVIEGGRLQIIEDIAYITT